MNSSLLRKSLSVIASIVLIVGLVPVSAFASEDAVHDLRAADLGDAVIESDGDSDGGNESEADAVYDLLYRVEGDCVVIAGYVERSEDATGEPGGALLSNEDYVNESALSVSSIMFACDDESQEGCTYDGPSAFEPDLVIPAEIDGRPVTAVADSAFEDAAWMETVRMPETLRSIGRSAFRNCANLRSASIPAGLETVGDCAFCDCASLTSAQLPEGVAYLDNGAVSSLNGIFSGCASLESYRVPASLGRVDEYMFSDCTSLRSVELPAGITSVGSSAFSGCSSLESVELPAGLESVGISAFRGCASLPGLSLPASLTDFGDSAFKFNSSWRWSSDLQDYVYEGSYELRPATWAQYWKLQSDRYVVPGNTAVAEPAEAPGELEFEWSINPDGTATITGCRVKATRVTIPSTIGGRTVTAIGTSAFKGDVGVQAVVLPATLKKVEDGAFSGCTALEHVLVPPSVDSIASDAFEGCTMVAFTCAADSYANGYAQGKGIPSTETISLEFATIDCVDEVTFVPGGIKPAVGVSVGETVLSEGRDFIVSYADNEAAGRSIITISAVEGSGYEGVRYRSFGIVPADISTAAIEGLPVGQLSYTGSEQRLSIAVKLGEALLAEGVDYVLSYSDNVNPGKALVTVTGKGNYAGSKSATFRIGCPPLGKVQRLAGAGRYETMAKIVAEGFTESECAVVATGGNFPDALAANALAGAYKCPVILTAKDSLSAEARSALESLGVKRVFVMGGEAAVSRRAADAVAKLNGGVEVERVAGANRQETSLEALARVKAKAGSVPTVIIATGKGFADTLSIGPFSYDSAAPIVLTKSDGTLTDAEVAAVKALGDPEVVVVGGAAAVSDKVKAQLGMGITRLGGANRYETSLKIANWELGRGLGLSCPAVATGANFPDALAGAALCGSKGSVMVLASANDQTALKALSGAKGSYVFGGPGAVPASVEGRLRALVS